MAPLDLEELIRDALTATSQLFKDRAVELDTDLAPVPGVVGDHDRLTQVVFYLLSNAVKFCDADHGEIRVTLKSEGGRAAIEVADNGIGIPLDQQDSIFLQFHQVHDQGTGKPGGTGLGLTVARAIVDAHGGQMGLESSSGQGSRVWFRLPL